MEKISKILSLFLETLHKREEKNLVTIAKTNKTSIQYNHELYLQLLNYVDGLTIEKNGRSIDFRLSIVDNNYLILASIKNNIIAIDLSKKNEADEWDIITLNNHFVITKTIGSFFTNKVWAWIDRGHTIWKEETKDSLPHLERKK